MGRLGLGIAGAAAVAALAGCGGGQSARPVGSLRTVPGCVESPGAHIAREHRSCARGRGFTNPDRLLFAPGGRMVYAVASAPAIGSSAGVLVRDPRTGRLRERGCLGPPADGEGCIRLHVATVGEATAPDGRALYGDGPTILARDRRTGGLTRRFGRHACFTDVFARRCTQLTISAIGVHPILSSDGRDLYVFSPGVATSRSGAVALYRRDRRHDGLTPASAVRACEPLTTTGRCGAPAPSGVAPASDPRSIDAGTGPDHGALSRDTRSLYVVTRDAALLVFARASDGALRQLPDGAGCIAPHRPGCRPAPGSLGPIDDVAVTADGRSVYARFERGIVGFRRDDATGTLRPIANGCLTGAPVRGCRRLIAGTPLDLILSPDARNAYVIASRDNEQTLVVLDRDAKTGALRVHRGLGRCATATRHPPCTRVAGLDDSSSLTLSPDGRDLYVASYSGSVVGHLRRDGAAPDAEPTVGRASAPPGPPSPSVAMVTPPVRAGVARFATQLAHAHLAAGGARRPIGMNACAHDLLLSPHRDRALLTDLLTGANGARAAIANAKQTRRTVARLARLPGIRRMPALTAALREIAAVVEDDAVRARASVLPCRIVRAWHAADWTRTPLPGRIRRLAAAEHHRRTADANVLAAAQVVLEQYGGRDGATAARRLSEPPAYPGIDAVNPCTDAYRALDGRPCNGY